MNASIDGSLLSTLFLQSFSNQSGQKYMAVIAVLKTQQDLTCVQVTSRMMQEFEAQQGSSKIDETQEDEGIEQELQLDARTVTYWY